MSSTVPNQLLKKPLKFCDGRDSKPTILKAPPQSRPARPRLPVDVGQVQLEIRNDPGKLKWVEQARLKFERNRNPYGQYGQPYKIGEKFVSSYDPIADVGFSLSRIPVKFRRVRAPAIPQLSSAQTKTCQESAGFGDIAQAPQHLGNYSMDIKRAVNHARPNGSAISNPIAPYTQKINSPVDGYTTVPTNYTHPKATISYMTKATPKDTKRHTAPTQTKNHITRKQTLSVPAKVQPRITVQNQNPRGTPSGIRERLEIAVSAKATPPVTAQSLPVPTRNELSRFVEERIAITPKIVARPPIMGGGGRVPVVANGQNSLRSRMGNNVVASAPAKALPQSLNVRPQIDSVAGNHFTTPLVVQAVARATPSTSLPVIPDTISSNYTMGRGGGPPVNPTHSLPYPSYEGDVAHSQYINDDHYIGRSNNISATTPITMDVHNSVTSQHPQLERAYQPGGFDAREDARIGPQTSTVQFMRNKGPATVGRGNFNSLPHGNSYPSNTSRPAEIDRYGSEHWNQNNHSGGYGGYGTSPLDNPDRMVTVEGYTDINPYYDDEVETLLLRGPVEHLQPLGPSGHPGMIDVRQDAYSDESANYYHQNRTKFSAGLNGISRAEHQNRELRERIDVMRGPGWTNTGDPILQRAWQEY